MEVEEGTRLHPVIDAKTRKLALRLTAATMSFVAAAFLCATPAWSVDRSGADTVPESAPSAPGGPAVLAVTAPPGTPAGAGFTVGANFTGSNRTQSGFIPPDTMGAVGPNHVVELINGRYAAYTKAGALVESSSLNAFWTTKMGIVPAGPFAFDPRIVYDPDGKCWIACAVDNPNAANNILLGVSTTNDPTGPWFGFQIDSDADDSHWCDFR